eukprot:2887257-Prymnesium_polylepis.1
MLKLFGLSFSGRILPYSVLRTSHQSMCARSSNVCAWSTRSPSYGSSVAFMGSGVPPSDRLRGHAILRRSGASETPGSRGVRSSCESRLYFIGCLMPYSGCGGITPLGSGLGAPGCGAAAGVCTGSPDPLGERGANGADSTRPLLGGGVWGML